MTILRDLDGYRYCVGYVRLVGPGLRCDGSVLFQLRLREGSSSSKHGLSDSVGQRTPDRGNRTEEFRQRKLDTTGLDRGSWRKEAGCRTLDGGS